MIYKPRHEQTQSFVYVKTKAQISFTVTAKLISTFVFATRIAQFLSFQNPKFQASSHLLLLHRPVCVRPGRKPQRQVFSRRGSLEVMVLMYIMKQLPNQDEYLVIFFTGYILFIVHKTINCRYSLEPALHGISIKYLKLMFLLIKD